ncbi:MAG: 4a-hydroxytetrahydrobiopterin dehydratase [Calditrichaeota bacterium]|nr:MAG: 4a-hydroxytetrahydrobiopterin dehydratase [Calditrichota bacterium]
MLLSEDQVRKELADTNGWELSGQGITRSFQFKDFLEAINFVNKVAEIAEQHDHHPDIAISYNKVQLSVFTHSEGGLTEKDFLLAREINSILT